MNIMLIFSINYNNIYPIIPQSSQVPKQKDIEGENNPFALYSLMNSPVFLVYIPFSHM